MLETVDLLDNLDTATTVARDRVLGFPHEGGPISRFYGCPQRIVGESIDSWVVRISAHYQLGAKTVRERIGGHSNFRSLNCRLDEGEVRRIAYVTLSTPSQVATRLDLGRNRVSHSIHEVLSNRSRYRPWAVYCPLCLRGDHIPFLRAHWQLTTTIMCEHHRVLLRPSCPHCKCLVGSIMYVDKGARMNHRDQCLRYCIQCQGLLHEGKAVSLPDRLMTFVLNFQRLALRVIAHGLHEHPLYGSISRNEFFEMYFYRDISSFRDPTNDRGPQLYAAWYYFLNWRRIVHRHDFQLLQKGLRMTYPDLSW